MKVISIKQPWASLIVNGYKTYEFRTWKTKYRGKILIHVSKAADKTALKRFQHLNLEYPLGQIIGEVELIDCLKLDNDLASNIYNEDKSVYKNVLEHEGYAWKLDNSKIYSQYIPMNGKLGLWDFEEK